MGGLIFYPWPRNQGQRFGSNQNSGGGDAWMSNTGAGHLEPLDDGRRVQSTPKKKKRKGGSLPKQT